jgi:MoaA/NifB/PqqE/SkfB family radical SAM enzyme
MANILLTSKCTRSCPYCFAEREMSSSPDQILSWENLIYLADFMAASGERNISLLGGEPTLHPQFVDFVLYLLQREFRVNVFTNGIMSSHRLMELKEHLGAVPNERLGFVCNLNNPEQTDAPLEQQKRVEEFLGLMGPWTQPGFNIYRVDFDLEFLFDLVNRYGMKRRLRLGLAHPVPGASSAYIKPGEIGPAMERLYSYRALFEGFQLDFGPDCGFPLCKFSDEQLGWLYRMGKVDMRFKCGPVIDITPDMSVYACFPLSNLSRRSIFEFDNLGQVADFFTETHRKIRAEAKGIYPECDGCEQMNKGICSGGGACQLLNIFKNETAVRLLETESELKNANLPV